jgi:hypothetical protein
MRDQVLEVEVPVAPLVRSLPEQPPGVVLRRGCQIAIGVFFIASLLLTANVAWGLAGIYLAFGLVCLSNYVAYRAGEGVIMGPNLSAMATVGSFGLSVVALVAGL